jgi:tripartite-type tricarboxylate transporter receptor subunit TctC
VAPAATPKEVLARLNGDVLKVLKNEELRKKIADLGADVVGNPAEEFGAAMRAESAQWAEVIKAAGIRVEE